MHSPSAVIAAAMIVCLLVGPDPARAQQTTVESGTQNEPTLDRATGKLAWELGTSLGVAAAVKLLGKEEDEERFKQSWTAAEQRAARLGVELERLPIRQKRPSENLTAAVEYLANARNAVAVALIKRYGLPVGHVFRFGANVGLLSRTYQLRVAKLNQQLATIIVADGEGSGLPAQMWRPLADLVSKGAAHDEVRAKLGELDAAVAEYFNAPGGQPAVAANQTKTPLGNVRPANRTMQQFGWEFGGALAGSAVSKMLDPNKDAYKGLWNAAEKMAETFGVEVEPLPERQVDAQANATSAVQYVSKARQDTASKLAARHGRQAAHVFRLTTNLVLLSALYSSAAADSKEQLGKAILADGKESGLPDELWRPLGEQVIASAAPEVIQAKLGEIAAMATQYFSNSGDNKPSVPADKPSVPADKPSVPADKPSVPADKSQP